MERDFHTLKFDKIGLLCYNFLKEYPFSFMERRSSHECSVDSVPTFIYLSYKR